MKKVICIQCGDFVNYKIDEIDDFFVIKDVKVKYKRRVALCECCHEEVWVDEVDSYNANAPIEQYCREQGLITISEIKELLHKYNIGKKPLSKLLGWGDITVSRYIDGQIPTKMYSEKLKSLNDPIEFYKLLEDNRDKITVEAYKNAIKMKDKILGAFAYNAIKYFNAVLNEHKYYKEEIFNIIYSYKINNFDDSYNGGKVCYNQLCVC